MKIEKISESQVKFILTKSDLMSRDINVSDLTYESEKTKRLFREMLDEARDSFSFLHENTPLMIEAMPSDDGIMIIISKVKNAENLKNGFDFVPESKSAGCFRPCDYVPVTETPTPAFSDAESKITVFSFPSLDMAADSAKRISDLFVGESSLYKNNDAFYLMLKRRKPSNELAHDDIEMLLGEYGKKQVSTGLSKAFIAEHGEPIIKADAVNILSTIF